MYVVISKWEFDPAKADAFEAQGQVMLAKLRSWPGVERAYNVRVADNAVIAIIAYTDEAAYDRLIKDPNGPFEVASREMDLESQATWLWSERGTSEAH